MPRGIEVSIEDGRVITSEWGDIGDTVEVAPRVGPGGLAGPIIDFACPVRWAVADALTANGLSVEGLFDSPCG